MVIANLLLAVRSGTRTPGAEIPGAVHSRQEQGCTTARHVLYCSCCNLDTEG